MSRRDVVSAGSIDRRTFLFRSALGGLGLSLSERLRAASGELKAGCSEIVLQAPAFEPGPLAMPGLFPGRVVEVHHPDVLVEGRARRAAVAEMVEAGLRELTGEADPARAWGRFVTPEDRVGIKVNPSGAPGTTSSHELVEEIVRGLVSAGLPSERIVVYDRSSVQMEVAGYPTLLPAAVRVVGLDSRWVLGPAPMEESRRGYDPEAYCEMNCFGERETRSYMGRLVSRELTKIINVPNLKEHNASGVTGCLKNLAYGSFNNVARTHRRPVTYTDPVIPLLCSAGPLRSKSVLHIMDGLRGVWHSGPFAWNAEFVFESRRLFFATDPVALDRIELEIIEEKRRSMGVPSLWDRSPEHLARGGEWQDDARVNTFVREPGHIRTAARLGLGTWELERIDLRKIDIPAEGGPVLRL